MARIVTKDRTEAQAYRALWSAVVTRAVHDAQLEKLLPSDKGIELDICIDAREWLHSDVAAVICGHLGIPEQAFRETIRKYAL